MQNNFNNSQIKAINHYLGPALIIAGPGSGKTFTITQRIKNLITERGIKPSEILVLTFTKAAAVEMQERFVGLMPSAGHYVNIGTFHSVFFNIIRHTYNYTAENIIKTEKKFEIISDIINKFEIEVEDEREFIINIINDISSIKGNGDFRKPDFEYESKAGCTTKEFNKIFSEYEEKRINNRLLDFDDMLLICNDLFKKRPEILSFWQQKFKYILIDEFQDINDIQYENIKMIASPSNNIFVVGDDDQSIYKFRGARPEIMHQFEKEFEKCEKITLEINYRSTENIVKFSQKIISDNSNRFKKSVKSIKNKGIPVSLCSFEDSIEQNQKIIEIIKQKKAEGMDYSDMAILFRTNMGAGKILENLAKENINFCFKDRVINIFEHWVSRDIFSYIKIACGNNSRKEFFKIINRPKRYISREAFKTENVVFKDLFEYYSDKQWMLEKLEKMEFDIRLLSNMKNPYAYVNFIRKGIGYEEYLIDYAKEHNIRPEELTSVLDEISESAKQFATLDEWYTHIADFGKKLKLAASTKNVSGAVNIATMHGAKGLEFDLVFVPDVNESFIPHSKAVFTEDIEEERRIFYVALTRAKNNLYIFYCKNKSGKKIRPSRFIDGLM